MGRVKKWFFATFFSCITKVKGKNSVKGSEFFRSNPRIIPENITPLEDAWLPIPSSSTPVYMDIDDYRKHSSDSMAVEQEKQIGEEDSGNHQQAIKEEGDQIPEQILDSEYEFSFWPLNDSKDIDICIADEIFSHGRLLPVGISYESAGNTRPLNKNKPRPKVQEPFRLAHQRMKAQIRVSEISRRLSLRNGHHKMSFWRFLRIGIMTMPEFQVHASSFAPRSFF